MTLTRNRGLALAGSVILAITLMGSARVALAAPEPDAACAALRDFDWPDSVVQSASVVKGEAGARYCRVRGYVRPAINFELHLPTPERWNQRFYMAGCGGFCGGLGSNPSHIGQIDSLAAGERRGYAVVMTDTGHWGASSTDGRWAAGDRLAFADYAYRSVGEVARIGKALTRAYYGGATIQHSVFDGCSNGGRQALIAATRYPEEFDGIVAIAPALDTRGMVGFFSWLPAVNRDADGKAIFAAAKLSLLTRAVARACGDAAGVVLDPLACAFDPATLQCRPNATDTSSCLTAAEVAVVRKWYGPPRRANGDPLFPGGLAYGSEAFWGAAAGQTAPLFAGHQAQATEMLRYMLTDPPLGEGFRFEAQPFETLLPLIERRTRLLTPSADLKAFHDRGGRLVMVQGWSDTAVPPLGAIAYYQRVAAALGGPATDEAVRLFMVPGFGHCRNPPGVDAGFNQDSFDALGALEQWFDTGRGPAALVATRPESQGAPRLTKALCAYRPASGGRHLARDAEAACGRAP